MVALSVLKWMDEILPAEKASAPSQPSSRTDWDSTSSVVMSLAALVYLLYYALLYSYCP